MKITITGAGTVICISAGAGTAFTHGTIPGITVDGTVGITLGTITVGTPRGITVDGTIPGITVAGTVGIALGTIAVGTPRGTMAGGMTPGIMGMAVGIITVFTMGTTAA